MSDKVEKILARHNKLVEQGRTGWTPAERDRCALLEVVESTFDLGKFDLELFLKKQAYWSAHTFGEGKRTIGIVNHIKSELLEIEESPDDLSEWIDVLILAFDATWRLGATPEEVTSALAAKQKINTERIWGPPPPEDQPSFHVREETADEETA